MAKYRLITLILVVTSFTTIAKAKESDEDLSSIIEQSLADQKKISLDLQKQLHTKDLGKAHRPNFKEVGEETIGRAKAETIIVDSPSDRSSKADLLDLDRKNLKRVSEEINDLK